MTKDSEFPIKNQIANLKSKQVDLTYKNPGH